MTKSPEPEFADAFIDDPQPKAPAVEPTDTAPDDGPPATAPEGDAPPIPPPDEPVHIAPPEEPPVILRGDEPTSIPSPEEPVGVAGGGEPLGILPEGAPTTSPDDGSTEAPSQPPETEGFGGAFIDSPSSSGIEDLIDEAVAEPPVIAPQVESPVVLSGESPAPTTEPEAPSVPAARDEAPARPAAPQEDRPSTPQTSPVGARPGTTPPSRVRVVVRDPMARSAEAKPARSEPTPVPNEPPRDEPPPVFPGPDDAPPPGPPVSPEAPPPEPPPVREEDVSHLPVIPLKPADSQPPAASPGPPPPPPRRPAGRPPARRPAMEVEEDELIDTEPVERGPLIAALLAAVAAIGALLSRLLNPLNRLERGEPIVDEETPARVGPALQELRTKSSAWAGTVGDRVGALAQKAGASLARRESTPEGASTQPPPPLVPPPPRPKTGDDASPSPVAAAIQKVTAIAAAGMSALREWPDRLADALRPSKKEESGDPPVEPGERPEESSPSPVVEPLASSIEPDEPRPAGSGGVAPMRLKKPTWRTESPAPAPRQAPPAVPTPRGAWQDAPVPKSTPRPKPPSSARELLSIPLAPRRDEPPEEVGHVYEGGGLDVTGFLHTAWAWTRLLLVLGAVGAVVAFAAMNWRTWFPKATELGRQAFIEVDKVARSGEFKKALDEAAAQLPLLSPDTVRRVQESSPTGLLEPVEVFRLANEAADRGQSALTEEEIAELQALRRELIAGLSATDRERVREYEGIRARREPFPVENASAFPAYARGARALPPESLERLQELLGKAIAAGLPTPEDGP